MWRQQDKNSPININNVPFFVLRAAVPRTKRKNKHNARAQLNSMIRDTLQSAADAWGMEVKRYEITEITPDNQISEAMDKQAAAERIRRCVFCFTCIYKHVMIVRCMYRSRCVSFCCLYASTYIRGLYIDPGAFCFYHAQIRNNVGVHDGHLVCERWMCFALLLLYDTRSHPVLYSRV